MPPLRTFTAATFRKLKVGKRAWADLIENLELGLPVKYAAQLADLNPATVSTWIRKGRQGLQPYDQVAEAFDRAKAVAVEVQYRNVARAALDPKNWKAAVYLLEHLEPEFAQPALAGEGDEFVIKIGGVIRTMGVNDEYDDEDDEEAEE